METIPKAITPSAEHASWGKARIGPGHYAANREAVMTIRAALIEGEASGEPQPFDVAAFKQRMLVEHA